MPKVDVVDLNNNVVGSVELADAVFAAPVNEALIYQAVHHYTAGQRAGTHKTKTRGEVSGSGRKLWKQKGTGRARIGSVRNPVWRHGGTVHGPQPRDYSYKLPKKMQMGALRAALTARLNDGAMTVVKSLELDNHKTGEFAAALKTLGARKKTLVIDNSGDKNLHLSSRNIAGVTVITSGEIHPYHLLGHERVIFSEKAAVHCSEVLQ